MGLSAALFAADVGGTYALDAHDRHPVSRRVNAKIDRTDVRRVAQRVRRTSHLAARPAQKPHHPTVVANARHRTAPHAYVERRVAVRHAPVRVERVAQESVAAQPRPKAAPAARLVALADLRDVRRFVIRRLVRDDRKLSVLSSQTYPVANGCVRVTMIVHDAHRRWLESELVDRGGTQLKVLGRATHAMPYQATVVAAGVASGATSGVGPSP